MNGKIQRLSFPQVKRVGNPSLKPPERFRASRNDIFDTSKLYFGVVYFKEICVIDSTISYR
jgi:hypothetical protein